MCHRYKNHGLNQMKLSTCFANKEPRYKYKENQCGILVNDIYAKSKCIITMNIKLDLNEK